MKRRTISQKKRNSQFYERTSPKANCNEWEGEFIYSYNGHGDTTNLTQQSTGSAIAMTATYEYDAFGSSALGGEAESNPFRYAGQYIDDETGLIYLRNRYYDPTIGRFTQEDPIKDGLNWYVYCANDPVNMIDLWGLETYFKSYHDNTDVYLRPMVEMYGGTIDVYDDCVCVNLNNKSQVYYYDTEAHGSVHGNRMEDGRMIVDAVEFGKHFELTRTAEYTDSKVYLFDLLVGSDSILPSAQTVNWSFSIQYIETPDNLMVFEQSYYIRREGWSLPTFEISMPDFVATDSVIYKNSEGEEIRKTTLKVSGESLLYSPYTDELYWYLSKQRVVLPKYVTATVDFTIWHKQSINGGYIQKTKLFLT